LWEKRRQHVFEAGELPALQECEKVKDGIDVVWIVFKEQLILFQAGMRSTPDKGQRRVWLIQQAPQVQMFYPLLNRLVGQPRTLHPASLAWPPHTDPLVVRFDLLPPVLKWGIQLFFAPVECNFERPDLLVEPRWPRFIILGCTRTPA
jgi:hypothetical protein